MLRKIIDFFSSKSIKILATLSGLGLVFAGLTYILWAPQKNTTLAQQAFYLLGYKRENYLYILSIVLSSIGIIPVIIIMTVKLARKNYVSSIVAGSFFIVGCIMKIIASLASLSRWGYGIYESARGDFLASRIFDTLQVLYVAIDTPASVAINAAGLFYIFIFWNKHRFASLLILFSIIIFIAGLILGKANPQMSIIFNGGSLMVFGIAYISIGDLTDRLFSDS
jgi:hypothetical protein